MVCAIFDAQTDIAPNALESFDDHRCAGIAEACKRHGLHLGLHTLSAVNVAEISPFLRNAVDRYLQAYVDLAARLRSAILLLSELALAMIDRKVSHSEGSGATAEEEASGDRSRPACAAAYRR